MPCIYVSCFTAPARLFNRSGGVEVIALFTILWGKYLIFHHDIRCFMLSFYHIEKASFYFKFVERFYYKWISIFSNAFSEPIDILMWFFLFCLITWKNSLISFQMLDQLCMGSTPGINRTWSCCIILFIRFTTEWWDTMI